MGVIRCNQHGKTGIKLSCPHLHQDFVSGQPLRNFSHVKFYIFDVSEDDAQIYPLCQECLTHYGFGLEPEKKLDWEDWFERLQLEPVCGECFCEYENSFKQLGY